MAQDLDSESTGEPYIPDMLIAAFRLAHDLAQTTAWTNRIRMRFEPMTVINLDSKLIQPVATVAALNTWATILAERFLANGSKPSDEELILAMPVTNASNGNTSPSEEARWAQWPSTISSSVNLIRSTRVVEKASETVADTSDRMATRTFGEANVTKPSIENFEELAQTIYEHLRRRLMIDQERRGRSFR